MGSTKLHKTLKIPYKSFNSFFFRFDEFFASMSMGKSAKNRFADQRPKKKSILSKIDGLLDFEKANSKRGASNSKASICKGQ